MDLLSALSTNFPIPFPIICSASKFQQWTDRLGSLTHIGTSLGKSTVGSKSGVHRFRYSPWVPIKYGAISENEILILLIYEFEKKIATAQGIAGDSLLEMWLPVPLNPIISGFCRGPEPHELTNQASLGESEGNFYRGHFRQCYFKDFLQFFDEFRHCERGFPLASAGDQPPEGVQLCWRGGRGIPAPWGGHCSCLKALTPLARARPAWRSPPLAMD